MAAPGSGGILQAADFSVDGSYSTGAKPAGTSDNDVMIPSQLGVDVVKGAFNYGAVPTDLDVLTVDKGFSRLVATSGTPLQISTKLLRMYGSSGFYFEGDDDGTTAKPIDDVLIDCAPNTPVELGTASGSHADQDYEDTITVRSGNVTLKTNCDLNAACKVFVDGAGATLNISDGMPNPVVSLIVTAGLVKSAGEITTATLLGGTLIQDTSLLTTVFVGPGATFVLNHTACTNIFVFGGGTVDFTQMSRDFKDVALMYLYKGANVIGQFQQGGFTASPVNVTTLFDFRMDP